MWHCPWHSTAQEGSRAASDRVTGGQHGTGTLLVSSWPTGANGAERGRQPPWAGGPQTGLASTGLSRNRANFPASLALRPHLSSALASPSVWRPEWFLLFVEPRAWRLSVSGNSTRAWADAGVTVTFFDYLVLSSVLPEAGVSLTALSSVLPEAGVSLTAPELGLADMWVVLPGLLCPHLGCVSTWGGKRWWWRLTQWCRGHCSLLPPTGASL